MFSSTTRLQVAKQAARRYTISATDGSGKISSLAVKVHGGSRYATKDGVSHLLSRFNFHNTSGKSALRLVRESELLGGGFQSKVDREFITLTATFLKEDLPYYVNALGNVLYKTSFRPYELPESVLPAAKHDLENHNVCPVRRAEDLLYNITYRRGLGNPVHYDGVEKVTIDDIKEFASKVYTKENIEIVGEGVNENDLKKFVSDSLLNSLPSGTSLVSTATPKASINKENRARHAGQSAAAIAIPVSQKDFAQYEALARYLTSPLSQLAPSIFKSTLDKQSTTGLFLLSVKDADANVVSENIRKVVSQLKQGVNLSAAKEYVSLQYAIDADTVVSPTPLNFDSVKNFKLGDFNYVAVGDVSKLPYADEL